MLSQNKLLYRTIVCLVKPFVSVLFPYEVRGTEKVKNFESGHILCSNHLSNLDPVYLAMVHFKPINFMAKAELFKNKLLSKFLSAIGVFAVNRGKSDHQALDKATDILKSGEVLGIFVEGTRSKTGEFLRPKSGTTVLAYNTSSPIIPVCITGGGKNNRIKLFKKTIIEYNYPILPEQLNIKEGTRLEIKAGTALIMQKIKELRCKEEI